VDAIEASAPLYVSPETVYEFVRSYDGVAEHSDHVERVERDGDGGPGTDYRITFSWWRLSFTSESRVTETERPAYVAWRSTGSVRARGRWRMEQIPDEELPSDREVGTELSLRIEFDPTTLAGGTVTRLLSLSRLVERVTPVVERECRSVLSGVVADLEGAPRRVRYTVHRGPDSF
jgi:uncharacterized membrane protein